MRVGSRRRSARRHLLGVIAAAVVPVWLFAAFLLTQYALNERSRFDREAMQVAEGVSVPVETYLANLLTIVEGLSRSEALKSGNYADFHRQASQWVAGTGRVIAVRNTQREILRTSTPVGGVLPPPRTLSEVEKDRLGSRQPVVSGVYADPATDDHRIAVSIPIDGGLVLEISSPTLEVFNVLKPAVPEPWTVGVGDRSGNYVSRSERHAEVTGTAGLPEYVQKVVGRSGTFVATNFQGDSLLAGYRRSSFSDWFYTANMPLSVVQAPMWRSLTAIGLSGLAALLVSGALAYFAGQSLATASAGLAKQAQALASGQPMAPLSTSVAEFALISKALEDAREALVKRTGEMDAVFETAPAAIWLTYDPQALVVTRNRFAAELMGLEDDKQRHFGTPDEVVETIARKDGQLVPREDRPLSRAMRGQLTDNQEYSYIVANGVERVLLSSARPILDTNGSIIGAIQISLDISERKKAWVQKQLLVNELNHRVKNTLAVVRSIASQTLRNAPDLETATRALSNRLISLSKAHDILTQESWSGADIGQLVDSALEPHAGASRYSISGTPVSVPPTAALSLALALHELTTNAVKYGALSNAVGRIVVTWSVEANPPRLRLNWREEGGPSVQPVGRQGFGTKLLERMFDKRSAGEINLEYLPEGLICTIELDISAVAGTEPQASN